MVHAKGADGRLRQCLHGACLDWLNPVQEAHFLRMGLVERIAADEQAAIAADAPVVPVDLESDEDEDAPAPEASGAVDECVATLARLQVPTTAGAPTARTALRGNGFRFGNDVVAAAVRQRKSSLSGTSADDEEFEVVKF
jgi:hypothetical protein